MLPIKAAFIVHLIILTTKLRFEVKVEYSIQIPTKKQ